LLPFLALSQSQEILSKSLRKSIIIPFKLKFYPGDAVIKISAFLALADRNKTAIITASISVSA
jgi:hypothetical protein